MKPIHDDLTLPPAPTLSREEAAPNAVPTALAPAGYELLEEVGRGGMGVVYKARQLALKRLVALKMILAGGHAGSELLGRFRAEAEVVARLQHPHIVQIYEVGTLADAHGTEHPFMALEFIDGPALSSVLATTPLPPRAAAQLVAQLADAMHAAHGQGIIHRDLKPANVLVATRPADTASGSHPGTDPATEASPLQGAVAKITDFGLAKQLDLDSQQTRTGAILGTPSYMPPEQAEGRAITPNVDVYALGAILYECLTGRPPFKAATPLDTVMQVVSTEPVPPRRLQPLTPADLETICLKCLEKIPARRYASAQELAADLRRFLANEPIQARPVGPLGRHSKWVRRQPLLAVLTYACFLVFVLALWEWREATRAQSLAEQRQRDLQQERDAADAQRQRAEAEALRACRFYYAADVNLAQQAMTTHQGQRLLAILERQVPEPGQTDLRTFEWHYLHGRTRTQSRAITLEPGASLDRMVAVGAGQQLLALVSGRREGKGFLEVRLLNAQDGTELQRWPSAGVALDVSLDGTLMAYSAGSNEVLVRRLADGEMVLRLPDMGALVSHVAFAPGGDLLAVVSMPPMPQQDRDMAAVRQLQATRMVRFFSMKGETVSVPLQTPGTSFFAVSVAFAPDGKHFVVGGAGASISQPMPGGIVALFDWPSGQLVRVHSGLPAVVPRVHFTPDGTRYAAASGSTLLAWETADGTERLRAAAHADAIHATALARSAPLLVTADLAGATMLWNLNGGRRLFAGYGHSGAVHSAAFLHGDQQFVTGGADGRIAFWSTSPPQSELTLHLPTGRTFPRAAFQEATFSPSGQTLATMDVNDVVLWDSQTWTRKSSFRIAEREVGFAIVRLLFTPAEDAIVAMGSDGQGSVWSLTGQKLAEIKMPPDEQGALQFNAAGTHLLGRHQRWRISDWRVEPVAEPGPVPRWCSPDGKLALAWERDQAFNADGTATRPHEPQATGTSEVLLFETETGRIRWRWSLPARQLQHAAFSRTGDQVAIGAGDGRIWVYDVGSGGVRSALKGHLRAIWSLAFAPDGQTLASASLDGTVRLWDPHIGQERLMFKNDPLVGGSVAFAPDGRTLAIGWGQNPLNPIRSATTTVYVTVPLAPNLTPLRPAAPAQPPISLRGPPGTVRPSR